ncbi:uncharacterized protein LOC144926270 [Branchiostoma floridae x Branchiostoma belcheri]
MNCSTPGCPSQRGPENSELCYACDCDAWVLEHCQSVNADQDDQDVEGRGDLATGGPDHQQAGSTGQPYRGAYNSTHRMMPNDADDISSNAVYESDADNFSDISIRSVISVPSSSRPAQVQPTSTTASPPTRASLRQDPVYPHRSQTPVKQPTAPSEVIGPLVSHQAPEDMVARQQDDTQPARPEDSVSPTPPPSERTAGEGTEDDSTQEEEGRHGPEPRERDSPAPPNPDPPPQTPTPNPPPEPQACLNPWCNRLGDAEHRNFCPVCYNRLLQENATEHPHPPPPYHGEPPPFPGGPEALLNPPAHSPPRNDSRNRTVYQNSQVHFHGCNIIFQ